MRDVTPEATLAVCDRNAPGIAEAIRAYSMTITKRAMLSRGASAIRGQSLIVNLPGSPKAVETRLKQGLTMFIIPSLLVLNIRVVIVNNNRSFVRGSSNIPFLFSVVAENDTPSITQFPL